MQKQRPGPPDIPTQVGVHFFTLKAGLRSQVASELIVTDGI